MTHAAHVVLLKARSGAESDPELIWVDISTQQSTFPPFSIVSATSAAHQLIYLALVVLIEIPWYPCL